MRTFGLLAAAVCTLAACGDAGSDVVFPADPDTPVIHVTSVGGLAPEMTVGRSPVYTLLADGRLIYHGPVIAIYPGPLLPNLQVTQLSEERVDELLSLIDEVGLPEMGSEIDDSALSIVADATTEIVTYWDENGVHTYSVYGLGVDPNPPRPATAATADLLTALSEASVTGVSEEFIGDLVRIISVVAQTSPDPEFEDIRAWPLDGEDPSQWTELTVGSTCKVFTSEIVESFRDATQVTQWMHPKPSMDAPPFVLLVRPLHPGEPDCPL